MNTKATYILVLFVIWGFISWYWYTCDIKGFCGAAAAQRQATLMTDDDRTPVTCEPLIIDSLKLGWKNPEAQMKSLERFLNEEEGEDLAVDGFFGRSDEAAVERFQIKYASEILAPYGRTAPTGFVHTETKDQINELHCARQQSEARSRNATNSDGEPLVF